MGQRLSLPGGRRRTARVSDVVPPALRCRGLSRTVAHVAPLDGIRRHSPASDGMRAANLLKSYGLFVECYLRLTDLGLGDSCIRFLVSRGVFWLWRSRWGRWRRCWWRCRRRRRGLRRRRAPRRWRPRGVRSRGIGAASCSPRRRSRLVMSGRGMRRAPMMGWCSTARVWCR